MAVIPRPWDFSLRGLPCGNQQTKPRISQLPLMLPASDVRYLPKTSPVLGDLSRITERTEAATLPLGASRHPGSVTNSRRHSSAQNSMIDWSQASYPGDPSTYLYRTNFPPEQPRARTRSSPDSERLSRPLSESFPTGPNSSPSPPRAHEQRSSKTPSALVPRWSPDSLEDQQFYNSESSYSSGSIPQGVYNRHAQPGSTPPLL